MKINITGRHVEITDALRDHLQARLDSAFTDFPRVENVHVILNLEKHRHSVEITAHLPRHGHVEAKAESHDMYASIDQAAERAATQLHKWAEKIHDRKTRNGLTPASRTAARKA